MAAQNWIGTGARFLLKTFLRSCAARIKTERLKSKPVLQAGGGFWLRANLKPNTQRLPNCPHPPPSDPRLSARSDPHSVSAQKCATDFSMKSKKCAVRRMRGGEFTAHRPFVGQSHFSKNTTPLKPIACGLYSIGTSAHTVRRVNA